MRRSALRRSALRGSAGAERRPAVAVAGGRSERAAVAHRAAGTIRVQCLERRLDARPRDAEPLGERSRERLAHRVVARLLLRVQLRERVADLGLVEAEGVREVLGERALVLVVELLKRRADLRLLDAERGRQVLLEVAAPARPGAVRAELPEGGVDL